MSSEQEFSEEEKKKAERAKLIVYVVMAVFMVVPFVLLYLKHLR